MAHESANSCAPLMDVKHFSLVTRDLRIADADCFELIDIAIADVSWIRSIARVGDGFIFCCYCCYSRCTTEQKYHAA